MNYPVIISGANLSRIIYLLFVFLISCSTILNRSNQKVTIKSRTEKAEVCIEGIYEDVTTLEVNLRRGKNHVFDIKLNGYEPFYQVSQNSVKKMVLLNGCLLCGSVAGAAIDVVSGCAYEVNPDIIIAIL